ncbi:NEDD4-binding protein 1-like [Styela clava]
MEESFVIESSKKRILQEKLDKINKLFNVEVEIQSGPIELGENGSQWVHVKSQEKNKNNITDAKSHIIALCNPECTERASFPGFPVFIFTAFKERCKYRIEKDCGVVLSVTDDAALNIHGTNIGVTLAISKIHHLRKLQRDLDQSKDREAAMQFDLYVEEVGDDCQQELQTLSNSLKKELLNILDIPLNELSLGATAPRKISLSPSIPTAIVSNIASPKDDNPETIVIEDSIIVISSSESGTDYDDDDDDETPSTSHCLEVDGLKKTEPKYLLPPLFAIREWIKIHYQCTGDAQDFVNKSDMLDHFKTHFDLPDHPELANLFFDKLAVTIFPQDPNYRSVRTKKTKSKRSRRRLVCLRRRTISESEKEDSSVPTNLGPDIVIPKPKPMNDARASKLPRTISPPTSASSLMKDWNSNRTGLKEIPPTINQPQTNQTTVPMQTWFPPPIQPVRPILNMPPGNQNLQNWLSTGPISKPRTQPKYDPKRANNVFSSIATKVSKMSNHELINNPRPQVNPNLRPIVIDGSNVAMSHGNSRNFSCRGIALCARFFMERGHEHITCFVPNYRKGGGGNPPSSDAYLLLQLEEIGIVKSTPSRRIRGQNVVCYDDRFIIELAGATNGVILSNDQYRDLMSQDQKFRPIVEQQLLQYTIVGDLLMLPEDPLGRNGPPLDEFLSHGRNGLNVPKQRVVKVPSPARPRQNPSQLPGFVRPPQHPMQRPRGPMPMAPVPWMHTPQQQTLSPDQNLLCYEMLRILPDRGNDIRKVITDNPQVTDIQILMEYLLISDQAA